MKAFAIQGYGKQVTLQAVEIAEPTLGEHEVMVRIQAAGVNPLDAKIRDGEFKLLLPYPMPLILGHDLAGVVTRVGAQARRFKVGDQVYGRADDGRIGTFAEFIAVKEDSLALKPATLGMPEAASIPLVGLTAWQALVEKAQLKKGQKVLIHAGAGGVGTFAIQLAKHLGATVATTTSAANIGLMKSLGADIVIDYQKDAFEKTLRDYDLVLNSLGGDTLKKSLAVLKPGGLLISISGPPDLEFAKRAKLSGFFQLVMRLLSLGIRRKAKPHGVNYSFLFMRASGDQLRQIAALIEAGVIRPVLDKVFPFQATPQALAYVETGRAKGKVVIEVQ
ncbi:MAG: NADP-dependent oxidoreductase [Pseudomonas sp.]|uniref:NADP-dependent oxidoreductase n=1 Tax=Pseudomonas sp. TaxID=306 RepID=UPI00339A53B4